jgi:uncharacterized membrane protein
MDTDIIIIFIIGIAFIGCAIFGKIRPDIMYKNRNTSLFRFRFLNIGNDNEGDTVSPERQKFGFAVFLLMGIMWILMASAMFVPQWQGHIDAIVISIAMVVTAVMLFMMWKYILSQNERWGRIALVAVLLLSVGLLVFAGYYWYTTLK